MVGSVSSGLGMARQPRPGVARRNEASQGVARQSWRVSVWQRRVVAWRGGTVTASLGGVWRSWRGGAVGAGFGGAGRLGAGRGSRGGARPGTVGLGVARQSRFGRAWRVVVWQGSCGKARPGGSWLGKVRQSRRGEVCQGLSRRGVLWLGSHGVARLGQIRCGTARQGLAVVAGFGRAWSGGVRRGRSRQSWHGMVSCGGIRFGSAVMVRCAMAGLGCSVGLGEAAVWQSRSGARSARLGLSWRGSFGSAWWKGGWARCGRSLRGWSWLGTAGHGSRGPVWLVAARLVSAGSRVVARCASFVVARFGSRGWACPCAARYGAVWQGPVRQLGSGGFGRGWARFGAAVVSWFVSAGLFVVWYG